MDDSAGTTLACVGVESPELDPESASSETPAVPASCTTILGGGAVFEEGFVKVLALEEGVTFLGTATGLLGVEFCLTRMISLPLRLLSA